MNKAVLIVAIAVLLAAIGGALYFYKFPANIPNVSPTPTPSLTPAPSEQGQTEDIKTFTSSNLAITFEYNALSPAGQTDGIKVLESGNKVYVYPASLKPEAGQWVEVFSKSKDETFEATIRRQILANYPSKDCKINVSEAKDYPAGFMTAQISYPPPSDTSLPYWANASLCNEKYDVANGIRYFLYDPGHADKFLYFDIGQYSITARGNEPWQNTVRLLPL